MGGEQAKSFWTSLPGAMTGVAGLMTAITGVWVALNSDSNGSESPTSTSPTSTLVSPASPESQRTSSSSVDNADAIAGSWLGQVSDGYGGKFRLKLEVTKGCTVGAPVRCGSIEVANTPCVGAVRLISVSDRTYQFDVFDFDPAHSNMEKCREGANEYFTPQTDGSLYYTTTYGPTGVVNKVG